jgi:hypothetical protein
VCNADMDYSEMSRLVCAERPLSHEPPGKPKTGIQSAYTILSLPSLTAIF